MRISFPPVTSTIVRRLGLASLVANIGIVVTGGAVRLTGSGLGCPTWPRCTDESWTSTAEMGIHGAVEFGNRTLTFVLGVLALACLVGALALRPRRRSLVWLAAVVLAGIALQGVIGGITVLTGLNPWVVGVHFLVSMGLIAVAYTFWRRVDEPDGPARPRVPRPLYALTWVIIGSTAALLAVGTVVTGSGPHAGDAHVARNGLDPEVLSQVHADLAFLLLGLAVAGWFGFRAVARTGHGPDAAGRAAAILIWVILAQGVVGIVQHYTGLPELLVGIHLLGSCLTWVAALHLRHEARTREPRRTDPEPVAADTALATAGRGPGRRDVDGLVRAAGDR